MKELNEELLKEVQDYYKKYKNFVEEKKELSSHNRQMKQDFMDKYFDPEDTDSFERKRLKKEITKYLTTIEEVGKGIDPVEEIKTIRKNHLDFDDVMHSELMTIYTQIVKNKTSKDEIDTRVTSEIYVELFTKLSISPDVVPKIMDLWYKEEIGKSTPIIDAVDYYRIIKHKLGNKGKEN